MTAFADTFALIAWLNPRDNAHAVVAAYLDGFTGRLVTTEWVLVELADALSAPEARATVVAFLQAVRADPLFAVIGYVPNVYQAGFDLFAGRRDKGWSLTDFISFGVMSERGLSEALTADHHFEQAVFVRSSNSRRGVWDIHGFSAEPVVPASGAATTAFHGILG